MSEISGKPDTPHAYLVAGGGGGMRSTIILRMVADELAGRSIPFTPIEGVSGEGGDWIVRHPSLQARDMEEDIARQSTETPLLVISHCIGTVAALKVVEALEPDRKAGLVSIAPPLPSPYDTISQPQSRRKRSSGDSLMRVVNLPDHAVDYSQVEERVAIIDPQYFADIKAAHDFQQRLRDQVKVGRAALFAPEHDWNAPSPLCVRSWHDDWSKTLPEEQAVALQKRALVVGNAAHGLYISPRVGREVTTEENVQFQMDSVNKLVDTGLDLLAGACLSSAMRIPGNRIFE